MLNTYIKNRGLTQTIVHKNNQNQFNEINWDAIYDGNNANISVNSNKNGRQNNFNISLDNQDLANILNIPSVNTPIHKRLQMDFENPVFKHDPNIYQIQLPPPNMNQQMFAEANPIQSSFEPSFEPSYENLLQTNHLSSPLSNEEFIIPLTIDEKLQDKRHHKHKKTHKKTHKTYKVYKKVKSSFPKSKSKSKSRKSKKSSSYSLF